MEASNDDQLPSNTSNQTPDTLMRGKLPNTTHTFTSALTTNTTTALAGNDSPSTSANALIDAITRQGDVASNLAYAQTQTGPEQNHVQSGAYGPPVTFHNQTVGDCAGFNHSRPNDNSDLRQLYDAVSQQSLCYTTAMPRSQLQTLVTASANIASSRANLPNYNMFDGTHAYSQTIPSATYAHTGMTLSNTADIPNIHTNTNIASNGVSVSNHNVFNSAHAYSQPVSAPAYPHIGTTPFNSVNIPYSDHSANFTMSSSQIAARQVITKDLPTFSGKPEEWPVFITNYSQSTIRCGFTDQENMIRLQKCLRGPALEAVRGKLMMPSTVNLAIETLRMLFGRPEIIHNALQAKLREEPKVRADNLNTLISLALAVQNYCATIQAIGLSSYLNDPTLLSDLLHKLPPHMKLDWGRHSLSSTQVNLLVFDQWLFSLATCASQVTTFAANFDDTNENKKTNNKNHARDRIMFHDCIKDNTCKMEDHDESSQTVPQRRLCSKCNGEHKLSECSDFISLKLEDRWQFIRQNKLCLRCFGKHFVRRCYSKKICGVDGCKMPHNTLLHTNATQQAQNIQLDNSKAIQTDVLFHSREQKVTMFRYIPITLYAKEKSVDIWALIDEGAACTLLQSDVATKLGLVGPSEELCLRWTGDVTKTYADSKLVSVDISSRTNSSQKYNLKNVHTIEDLDLPEQCLERSILQSYECLRDLPIISYSNVKPQMIIGLDNAKLGVPLKILEVESEGIMAAKCRLGWAVYGRKHVTQTNETSVFHICECSDTQQEVEKMDELMQHYFSLDSVGVAISSNPLLSTDDERALRIMEATTMYKPEEKKWHTGLLWKYDQIELPNSFPMAMRRLKCLETKMEREPALKHFLIEKIAEHEQKGYIRKLKGLEVTSGGKSWYIPIFTVTNVNKNKRRLVWDAAAKVNGVALNTFLLKGPDLLISLVGVLLRFREYPVALTGDIREMFHQVKIIPEDQISQMFLWRAGDSTKDVDVYCMQVMTFGAACSPSLANYIKNKNANRFIRQHPRAVNAILENTFVDDWLQSCKTEDEMMEMAKTVRDIHADGGFEMRNWISNSARVLECLTKENIQSEKCIQQSNAEHEKILGMWWVPQTDELAFIQKFDVDMLNETAKPTKRQILQIVMKIFDPLGILGHFIIHAKVILQDVWRSGVSWDEPLKEDELIGWRKWVRYIPTIGKIRIPRSYSLVSESQNIQLHVFVDASSSAYAAVAYIRSEVNVEVKCSFVASKTRVAPLKPISIPRMELMAAVIGLRLATFIEKEQSIKIGKRIFWSDSKDVLYWIRSDARKFKQFVALRVGEILQNSKVNEWRWVPSAENVADEGTKWSKTPEFHSNTRWFSGPTFLLEDEQYWPVTTFSEASDIRYELLCHIEEENRAVPRFAEIYPDPSKFSTWEKLRRTLAYVLRFIKTIMKTTPTSPVMKILSQVNDIHGTESIIFRQCQEESYPEEIKILTSKTGQISRTSSLYKCSPYLDEMEVLRIKGRIDAAEVNFDLKRPIILPREHAVTKLVIDFYHRRFHHHHNEIVVNELRQRFWIPGLRALVRSVANNCQTCKNNRAAPSPPEMGDLPPERLAAYTRPFTYVGVDCFGPFDVVVGRRREKRWGVLFTCLTVRAVHIEISSSLSTDAFMLVFKQFVARRGTPRRIISDNGTNFRGASRLLATEIEKISGAELERSYPEIEWHFIPPASPHMGGAWERMVRSVKSILMEILPESGLREETLRGAMADVENIINSRPLTYVPLESVDAEALTPNHFLLGNSSGIRDKGSDDASGLVLLKSFKISSHLSDKFWKRWVREYLPSLTRRTKWFSKNSDPIVVGDVVIVVDDTSKRGTWPKGIVVDVHRGKDNQVRSAVVKTIKGLMTRPTTKLAKLDVKK